MASCPSVVVALLGEAKLVIVDASVGVVVVGDLRQVTDSFV